MNNTDLIIFSGQSNMEGETERLPDDNSPIPNALEYRYLENKLIPLRHPAGENISTDGRLFLPRHRDGWGTTQSCSLLSAWRKHANMVPFFCDEYVKGTGRRVIAVHCAKGATTVSEWQRGQISYDMLIKKAKGAIQMTNPEHIYFVWLQGESDALLGTTKEEYKKHLINLYESLKSDLGIDKFCNILVGKFAMNEFDDEIKDAQRQICNQNEAFIMLTDIIEQIWGDERYMNPNAFGHFSCDGLELIGRAGGKSLAKFVTNTNLL